MVEFSFSLSMKGSSISAATFPCRGGNQTTEKLDPFRSRDTSILPLTYRFYRWGKAEEFKRSMLDNPYHLSLSLVPWETESLGRFPDFSVNMKGDIPHSQFIQGRFG